MKEGHRVTIATHEEYADWIKSHGIGHRSAGGDPGALMKLSVENKVRVFILYVCIFSQTDNPCKMLSPQFFKESITFVSTSPKSSFFVCLNCILQFRPWLDQLLLDAWAACHDADVLCESPSAFAGVHIAEALGA